MEKCTANSREGQHPQMLVIRVQIAQVACLGMEISFCRVQLSQERDSQSAVNPSAGRCLEEGLEETLTVQRLELPELLRVSLRGTDTIESSNSGVRDRGRNVKRWQGGEHVERWTAA